MDEIVLHLLLFLCGVLKSIGSPLHSQSALQPKDIIEGDILVTKPLEMLISEPHSRTRREITTKAIKRWTNGVVPYTIDKRLGKSAKKAIRRAIREFHKHTCVHFVSRTAERDYVHFSYDYGCYSPIGRQGGEQKLSVGEGCEYHGTVMHELMHALGFFHEHSRYDRDKFVKILWWNIEKGFLKNFNVYSHGVLDTLNTPYDYNSLMHYDKLAFSKNRQSTIEALDRPDRDLGQKDKFSDPDVEQLLKVYPCRTGHKGPSNAQPKKRVRKHREHKHKCRDLYPGPCKLFASHVGYCQDWKAFMSKYCPVACDLCSDKEKRLELWSARVKPSHQL